MAFREGVLVFNQAGALPGPALKQVVDAVKGLDMAEVHKQWPSSRTSTRATRTSEPRLGESRS